MKKVFILSIFAIIMFFGLCGLSANAEIIKFAQVTDVHINSYNVSYLRDFVKEINKQNDLDFVVFTGDNIDNANIDDLKDFLEQVSRIKFRTYILIGNHDVFKYKKLDKVLYMKTVKKYMGSYHSDKPNYVFTQKGVVFIVMDGVKEVIPAPSGYYKQADIDWLESMLNKYSNKKVVILQHFPLLETNIEGHNTYGREEYLEMLKRHNNVIAIISGHFHTNKEEKINNVYHIVTKNFSNNRYYKIIEIDSDTGMVYTYLKEKKDGLF